MANEQTRSNLIDIQPADPLADLKNASPHIRYAAAFMGAALAAYLLTFGSLAIAGFWRTSLFSLRQVGLAISILVAHSIILWLCRVRPGLGGAVFGLLWSIPLAFVILKATGPDDVVQALILISVPLALSLLNGLVAAFLMGRLELPFTRRQGGKPSPESS